MANFTGNDADNVLIGTDGDDQLLGLGGNDLLDGRFGFDVMDGGDGNDTTTYDFYFGGINANLQIGSVTFPGNSPGSDTVLNIENVIGSHGDDTIIGDGFDNFLAGGEGNDLLDGSFGFDTLDGGAGNDTTTYDFYSGGINANLQTGVVSFPGTGDRTDILVNIENVIGSHGNDTIVGDGFDNFLAGGDGDDLLDGSFGFDTLDGGAGNDTATYDFYSGGINADLQTGVVSFPGTGDRTDSLINIENVIGSQGNDTIIGNALDNKLSGGIGNDLLNGKEGNDQLFGGAGDDIYILNDAGDQVTENSNDGLDIIASSVSYTLSDNVEHLGLTGSSNINATGNALDNVLLGNAGVNTLDGGAGKDILIGLGGKDVLKGGAGADKFAFIAPTDGVDRVVDFSKADGDKIALLTGGFNGLSGNSLQGTQFVLGNKAKDGNDRFIYNQKQGTLFYDADGKGGVGQVQLATFDNKPGLRANDFLVVATPLVPSLPAVI